jgi:hypothetical protein
MKALPQNVTAFKMGGWAMHNLDQKMLRRLKRIADRNGFTLEEAMTDAVRSFLAECELEEKIIRFPANADRPSPSPRRLLETLI